MKKLQIISALFVAYLTIGAGSFAPYQLFGAGSGGGGGGTFTGPGNIVSGAIAYYGGQAYTAAYASSGGKFANVCLSGDTTCADLVFGSDGKVIDATVGGSKCSAVTCTVKTLYDQSGASSCTGACDVTQATESKRCTLSFISSLAYLVCNGANSQTYASALLSSTHAQPYTISSVLKYTNTGVQQGIETNTVNQEFLVFRSGAENFAIYSGTSVPTGAATAAAFHACQCVFNGASSDVYIDGTTNPGALGNTNAFPNDSIFLFSNVDTGQYYTGTFAMLGVWPSGFNSTQQSNMNSNEHTFWGF